MCEDTGMWDFEDLINHYQIKPDYYLWMVEEITQDSQLDVILKDSELTQTLLKLRMWYEEKHPDKSEIQYFSFDLFPGVIEEIAQNMIDENTKDS